MNIFGKHPAHPDYGNPQSGVCFKGGGGSSTTTNEPWAEQRPFLERGFQEAEGQFEGPSPEYFPGSTVQPLDPNQTQAFDRTTARAQGGNPLLKAGQAQVGATLGGNFMNPDISGVARSIDEQIRPRVGAQFAQAGRNLSPAHAGAYSSGFTNAIAPFAFSANQQERGRMMQASGMAPGLANADYNDIDRQAGVGQEQRAFGQEGLQDEINRHNFEQNVDSRKLQEFMGLVGNRSYGGSTTQPVSGGK